MNCQNCGNLLTSGAAFCRQCGTPVAHTSQPPQQPIYQQPVYHQPQQQAPQQPLYTQPSYTQPMAAPPVQVQGTPLPENPLRVTFFAGGMIILMLLTALCGSGADEYTTSYLRALFVGSLACSVFLITKGDSANRIFSLVIAGSAALIYSLSFQACVAFSTTYSFNLFALFHGSNILFLVQHLVVAAAVVGTAFGTTMVFKRNPKRATLLIGLISAGSYMLITALAAVLFNAIPSLIYFFTTFFSSFIMAAALFGTVMLASMISNFRSTELQISVGYKVWFSVCIFFSTISFITVALGGIVGTTFFSYVGFLSSILTIGGIVGYILLFFRKRIGFPLILISIGVMIAGDLSSGFSLVLQSLMAGNQNLVSYGFGLMATSLTSLVNPAITGIALYFAWKKIPAATAYQKPLVTQLQKIFAIAGTAVGGLLFIIGSFAFYNLLDLREITDFILGVCSGAVVLIIGIAAFFACFRKESRVPKGLLMTNRVTAIVGFVFLLIVITGRFLGY